MKPNPQPIPVADAEPATKQQFRQALAQQQTSEGERNRGLAQAYLSLSQLAEKRMTTCLPCALKRSWVAAALWSIRLAGAGVSQCRPAPAW